MRIKTKVYLIYAIAGMIVMLVSMLLGDNIPKIWQGVLTGLGGGAFGMGAALFTFGRWEESKPEIMKQNEIEAKDERNLAIRYRAQALSGMILQWVVLIAAWVCILADGPIWVTLTAVGTFLAKNVLELVLIGYYQRKM